MPCEWMSERPSSMCSSTVTQMSDGTGPAALCITSAREWLQSSVWMYSRPSSHHALK
jgi:hypothetical protein